MEAVPCGQPHAGEVVGSFELPEGDWPGLDPVLAEAENRCAQVVLGLPPSPAVTEVEIFYYHPGESTWEDLDDREVLCVLTYQQARADSVRG